MKTAKFSFTVEYDEDATSPVLLEDALNTLMGTAQSTDGILYDHGNLNISDIVHEKPQEEVKAVSALPEIVALLKKFDKFIIDEMVSYCCGRH